MNRWNVRAAVAGAVSALVVGGCAPAAAFPADLVPAAEHDVSATRLPTQSGPVSARRLVLDAPESVPIGSAIPVRGRTRLTEMPLARTDPTEVRITASLAEHIDGRRSVVDHTVVRRRGRFRLEAPPSTVAGRRDFTVIVKALRRGGSVPTLTDSLVIQTLPTPVVDPLPEAPAPEPPAGSLGDASDWTFIGADPRLVTRWNPCSTITWSYDPTGGYAGALDDMTVAMARVSAVSGLDFSYVGSTGGKITVGWSDAARTPALAGTTVGLGGVSSFRIAPELNNGASRQVVAGNVTLDREASLLPGRSPTAKPDWGQVMVHEAMHAIGLGHARENTQVLYPYTATKVFGAGDWAGLVAVGADQGCLVPVPGYERARVTRAVFIN